MIQDKSPRGNYNNIPSSGEANRDGENKGDLSRSGIELQNINPEIKNKEDGLFSGNNNIKHHAIYTSCQYPKPIPTQFKEQAIVSSLFLQKLMYFNTFYCFLHGYLLLFAIFYRFKVADNVTGEIILLVVVGVWIFFEWFRLNNGYSGNINETFPEFVSFVLLTIANIALCIVYLVICQAMIGFLFSIEVVIEVIEIIFLVLELLACFNSIGSIVKAQLLNRKSKKKKAKTIEIEQFNMYDEVDGDVDEQQDRFGGGGNFQENNDTHYTNGFSNNNLRRRVPQQQGNEDDVDEFHGRSYDENVDPQQASNVPYSRNYNVNQYPPSQGPRAY